MFVIILLWRFICLGAIKTSKANSISKISYYDRQYVKEQESSIIKFVNFMSSYYVINFDIISSFMVFRNLYIGFIDIL